jgi:hypothetical protein
VWRVRADGVPLIQALATRRFLVLFAVPVALHFAWNSAFQLPLMLKYALLGFLAYVVIFSLVQSGLKEVCRTASPARLDLEAPDPTTMMKTVVRTAPTVPPAPAAPPVVPDIEIDPTVPPTRKLP